MKTDLKLHMTMFLIFLDTKQLNRLNAAIKIITNVHTDEITSLTGIVDSPWFTNVMQSYVSQPQGSAVNRNNFSPPSGATNCHMTHQACELSPQIKLIINTQVTGSLQPQHSHWLGPALQLDKVGDVHLRVGGVDISPLNHVRDAGLVADDETARRHRQPQ